jgi:hypothetical protein
MIGFGCTPCVSYRIGLESPVRPQRFYGSAQTRAKTNIPKPKAKDLAITVQKPVMDLPVWPDLFYYFRNEGAVSFSFCSWRPCTFRFYVFFELSSSVDRPNRPAD